MKNPIHFLKFSLSFVRLVRNLEHLDDVLGMNASFIKMGSKKDIIAVVDEMKSRPAVRQAFIERYRFPKLNGESFTHFPVGTLGREYGEFLIRNKITPASFPDVNIKSDMDYLTMHLYETHDLWHVLTGYYGTDVESELELQAFYVSQTPGFLPVLILIASLFNSIFFEQKKFKPRFDRIVKGYQKGKLSKNLVGIDWKQYLELPLENVRKQFSIPTDFTPEKLVLSNQAFA